MNQRNHGLNPASMTYTSVIRRTSGEGKAPTEEMTKPRLAVSVAIAALTAVAGGAAVAGAQRLDDVRDVAADDAALVAGLSLFASALLAVLVCLARTRIEMQRDQIERLRVRALDAELRADLAEVAGHEPSDWFDVRESER